MPTKEWGVVITVVREGREVREPAKLQLDLIWQILYFSATNVCGHLQHSRKCKQTWREMLTPHHVTSVKMKCLCR